MDVNLQPSGVTAQGTFTPDELIAGSFPIHSIQGVILSGSGVLKRGTVLEVSGTAGKYRAVTTDANALYILAEDVDATSADKTTVFYVTGTFNKNKLFYGSGGTFAGCKPVLEARSIFLVDSVAG